MSSYSYLIHFEFPIIGALSANQLEPHFLCGCEELGPGAPGVSIKTCSPGVREPGGVAGAVPGFTPLASPDVASQRGVTCSRGVREPHGTWHQNVASSAIHLPGLAGRGVRRPRPTGVSSKCVFSRRAICAPPQTTPPKNNRSLFHITCKYPSLKVESELQETNPCR